MTRRSALAALGVGAGLPLLTSCGSLKKVDAEFTLVVAHASSTDHFFHRSYLRFKELVEEGSSGRILVKVFPNAVFGGDAQLATSIQIDGLQMTAPTTSALAPFSPDLNVWDLPYLFDDREHAFRVLDGDFGRGLLDRLEEVELIGLGYWENGYRHLTTQGTEVRMPEDMSGVKIRVQENPTQLRAWNATGANATPMAFSEVYTGLQQGTIDSQENPLPLIATQKFYEVQDHLVLSAHIYSPSPLILSKTFFDSLPEQLQSVVREAGKEATAYNREESVKADIEADRIIRDAGVTVTELSESGREAFKSQMQDAAEPFLRGLVGDELVDGLNAAIEENR